MRSSTVLLCGLAVVLCLQGTLCQVPQPTGGCPPGGCTDPIDPIGKGSFGGKRPACPVQFTKWFNGYQYTIFYGILRNYTESVNLCAGMTGTPGSYGPGLVAPSLDTHDSNEDIQAIYKFYSTFLPDTLACTPSFRSWYLAPKTFKKGVSSCVVFVGDKATGQPTSIFLKCNSLRPIMCRVAAPKALY